MSVIRSQEFSEMPRTILKTLPFIWRDGRHDQQGEVGIPKAIIHYQFFSNLACGPATVETFDMHDRVI